MSQGSAQRHVLLLTMWVQRFMSKRLAVLLLCTALDPSAQAAASAQAVDWVTLQDPLEQAFSVEVPRGWVVRTGLFRFGLSDVRPLVDLTSPDGRINVRLGDVATARYALPGSRHSQEGERDDLGAQEQRVVARYRSGPEFVVLYSRVRFAHVCRHAVTDTRDIDFMVPDYAAADTPTQSTSTGQIAYYCMSEQGGTVSFAFARTTVSGCCWMAPTLASFVAPADQVGLARAVLLHTLRSFQLSEAWKASQRALEAEAVKYQQWRRAHAPADLPRLQAVEQRVAQQRAQASRYCGQFADLSIADPLTASGSPPRDWSLQDYWANGLGDVVSAPAAPSAAWRPVDAARTRL